MSWYLYPDGLAYEATPIEGDRVVGPFESKEQAENFYLLQQAFDVVWTLLQFDPLSVHHEALISRQALALTQFAATANHPATITGNQS